MKVRSAALGAAAGLAVLACLLPAAPVAAAPAPGGGFSGSLTDVSCPSPRDCWAVGGTGNNVAIADHWNGSAWSVVHLPAPRGNDYTVLPSVSCPGVTSCWAVGWYQSVKTSKELPYAEHWNGTAWSAVALPDLAGSFFTEPRSVSCASAVSCWAVGTASSGPVRQLLERWNGRAWALQRAPAIGARSTLEAVFCASAANCWITGTDRRSGTLAAHWDGRTWSVTPAPTSGTGAGELLSVACVKRDCMSVGDIGGDHPGDTLAEHWNGSAWTVTPTGRANAIITGVSCTAGFRCVATGNTLAGRVFSVVWNGSAWRTVPPEVRHGSAASGLVGVSCVTAADCWSVGNGFNGAEGTSLIEHWNGSIWSVAA